MGSFIVFQLPVMKKIQDYNNTLQRHYRVDRHGSPIYPELLLPLVFGFITL